MSVTKSNKIELLEKMTERLNEQRLASLGHVLCEDARLTDGRNFGINHYHN